ncbi:flavin-containing monooxygenase [Puerhibacterium sp. TATVAM-FAB25]|uniref:flavin-containing monooxygenase n=1 Tax=Puerhibacterium sp. TATVAM-FAB25 TaxID=3093699 RepID=UPI00397E728E
MAGADVVVVGAGAAGISVALAAKRFGLGPLVLDQAPTAGAAWRGRYDRLRLNTSRPFSHLPGRPFPRGTQLYPTRDQLVAHLDRHAHEDGIRLRLGVRVERIDRAEDAWQLDTSDGEIRASQVVVASGYENEPFLPGWAGRERFQGHLVHSSQYRSAAPFRGLRVLVVGSGSSGMEIAYDLVEGGAARVWLAARTPPNIVLRTSYGPVPGDVLDGALMRLPVRVADWLSRLAQRSDVGDLAEYGLPFPDERIFARIRRTGAAPTIVDREVVEAIRARRFEVVAAVESLEAHDVVLADGRRLSPDAVVCATGYRRGLETLVGHLGVLDDHGAPRRLGADPAAPGLRFVGYVPRPGALKYIGHEARAVAGAVAREQRKGRAIAVGRAPRRAPSARSRAA